MAQKPRGAPRLPSAHLSRSQIRVLADKLEPTVNGASRRDLAARLGVKEHVVEGILQRKAALNLPHASLVRLAEHLKVDVSGWDVSKPV